MKKIIVILFLLSSVQSHACKCAGPKTMNEYSSSADIVVKGNVISQEKVNGHRIHKVEIIKKYKGMHSSSHIEIKTDARTSCQFGMGVGETYLIFATIGRDSTYWTGQCSGTQIFDLQKEKELDSGKRQYIQEENQINGEINTGQCAKVQIVDSLNQDALQSDKFTIEKLIIEDGCIKFKVVYGGGCGITDFNLITDNRITESMAPSMDVYLKLTDNDFCKAIRYGYVSFNLNEFLPSVTDLGFQVRIINNDSVVALKK